MPQVLKQEIREKILKAALNQFYRKDFKAATMKMIATEAKIPTGLIYSYFKNKEDLFQQVVQPAIVLLKDTIMMEPTPDPLHNLYENEIPTMLRCIQKHNKEIVLLIDKSEGSKQSSMKEAIINEVAQHLRLTPFLANTEFDDIFYHILATNFMEGVFEIARHFRGREWAKNMLDLLLQQHLYGSSTLSKIKKKKKD
jgi:AcrR family transcriptional regulator